MAINARQVDPRDESWEVRDPAYRVYFWDADQRSEEWELSECDVHQVLKWAHESSDGRTFAIYAAVLRRDGLGLIRLLGEDPNEPL